MTAQEMTERLNQMEVKLFALALEAETLLQATKGESDELAETMESIGQAILFVQDERAFLATGTHHYFRHTDPTTGQLIGEPLLK